MDDSLSLEELREEIDDLRDLVKTLLTIIMEEADGVQSGAAPSIPINPSADIVCSQYPTGSGSVILQMYHVATVLNGFQDSVILVISLLSMASPLL